MEHMWIVSQNMLRRAMVLQENTQTSTVCQQENYDAKKIIFIYNKGDLVWFLDEKTVYNFNGHILAHVW